MMTGNIVVILLFAGVVLRISNVITAATDREEQPIFTTHGPVKGKTVTLVDGTVIRTWYGIPFAMPPVGDYRFQDPQAPARWSNVFNATHLANVCMQNSQFMPQWFPGGTRFSEDCLTLNVFAPQKSVNTAPLTVMVWIYGGGYATGGNTQYMGHFLAAKDVIVVIPNYRVGIFGFLATPNGTVGGNMGLKDQTMSLRWVHDNIEKFGGDPGRVTLFGQSAGAASVSLHLVSPLSKGLFYRAIIESGSDRSVWTINYPEQNPKAFVYQTAKHLNCDQSNDETIVDCLKIKTTDELLKWQKVTCFPTFFSKCSGYYSPIVDGPDGFLPKLPIELDAELNSEDAVATLSGINRDDGSFLTAWPGFVPESVHGGMNGNMFDFYLRRMLSGFDHGLNKDKMEIVFKAFQWHYGNISPYVDNLEANRQSLCNIITDYMFGMAWDAQIKAKATKHPNTYGYVFEYRSSSTSFSYPEWLGAFHSIELPFIFGYPKLMDNNDVRIDSGRLHDDVQWTGDDVIFSEFMMDLWTNFAKFGNPTPQPTKSPFSDVTFIWPKFSSTDHLKVVLLNDDVTIITGYNQRNYAFFSDFISHVIYSNLTPKCNPLFDSKSNKLFMTSTSVSCSEYPVKFPAKTLFVLVLISFASTSLT